MRAPIISTTPYTFNWNSLLADGATMQTIFLFTAVQKKTMTKATMDTVMRAFSWSMNVLLCGEHPRCNHEGRQLDGGGEQLAGGYRACLAQK